MKVRLRFIYSRPKPNRSIPNTSITSPAKDSIPWVINSSLNPHSMCLVVRNRFSCTKDRPIHLLIDHSHPSTVCKDSSSSANNLARFCSNAFFVDKPFKYSCNICARGPEHKEQHEQWLQEHYTNTKASLESR